MRFFLAGIMQGSHRAAAVHSQDYRSALKRLLEKHFPGAEIYDPWADHGSSLTYNDAVGRAVFYRHNRMCRDVDVVIAFVPEASMGTAIEMWEAHEHGRGIVLTISPLAHNWAIRFCSHAVYETLDDFENAITSGAIARLLDERRLGSR